MRRALALSWIGVSIVCSGCALVEDATRNVVVGVTAPIETHREVARNKAWAEAAWQKVCSSGGPREFSADYTQGFKDGYAEYLFRGGDGEPPLLAPAHYRHLRYQTPEGYQAVEDWFAGYRQGAATARDTGARRWITGPTGLLPEVHEPITEHLDILPPPRELPKLNEPVIEGPAADERPRAMIKGISVAPAEPTEPIRARITTVTPVPAKD
jgi:hypothetical protein